MTANRILIDLDLDDDDNVTSLTLTIDKAKPVVFDERNPDTGAVASQLAEWLMLAGLIALVGGTIET